MQYKVLDLSYHPDEGQVCFAGAYHECEAFVAEQTQYGGFSTYDIVPNITEAISPFDITSFINNERDDLDPDLYDEYLDTEYRKRLDDLFDNLVEDDIDVSYEAYINGEDYIQGLETDSWVDKAQELRDSE